ncbi:MAG TPA: DinB family protein [Anaerolineales bacterium]|nr:DinB family protein [Anaerolineales bacterium]
MEFETLYQELRNSTDIINTLLLGISQEESQFKPTLESWSILEVTCHLYDEEREDFRDHLDFILHRQSEEWHQIDPQGWVTERKYNEQDFQLMQDKFFAERRKSLQWLKGLADAAWDTTYTSQYGSTSAGEMFACWVAHDNLHIRQLVELRRAKIENITKPHNLEYAGDW